MSADQTRLQMLLNRLDDLETLRPAAHERAIVEAGKLALREEVSKLAHALHDRTYWRARTTPTRVAG